MTSTSPPAYPAEYYYPELTDSRSVDLHVSPPPLATPVTTTKNLEQTKKTKQNLPIDIITGHGLPNANPPGSPLKTDAKHNLLRDPVEKTIPRVIVHENIFKQNSRTPTYPITNLEQTDRTKLFTDVVTDQGLPDAAITSALKTDTKKNLIRDPVERNIPRLIVNNDIIQQAIRTPTFPGRNRDNKENIESKSIPHEYTYEDLPHQTRPIESISKQQHQYYPGMSFVENQQPIDDYWKKEVLINDQGVVEIEPIKYDKNTYEGPFGLTRQGSLIFYISLSILAILGGVSLILTGVFYSKGFPSSSQSTAELAGIGVCGFVFYFGLQLILIGLWHQSYRQENPIIKKSTVHNESSQHLKSSMEHNEQYNYSYQQPVDHTPYAYYSNPPYTANVNEQTLLQQPGAATGAAYYEPVIWPSNIQVETEPDPKFYQPMERSLGPKQSTMKIATPVPIHTSISNLPNNKMERRSKHNLIRPIDIEPPKAEFDDLIFQTNDVEQDVPVLQKAPETTDMIKSIALMEQNLTKTSSMRDISPKRHDRTLTIDNKTDISSIYDHDKDDHHHHHHHRHHRIEPIDNKTDLSSFNDHDTDDHHHHRHRHHRSHSHHHHGHHHGHHHSRHHHHHRRRHSPFSESTYYSHDFHRDHIHAYPHPHPHPHVHHHHQPVALPRILTPQLPKIITPTPQKTNTSMYRDTGVNTGNQTKIMRDSSVTADLDDIPNVYENPLEKIPIIRRTIIVEPYPAQPSSQIIVKPRADMIGKIRLGKNTQLDGENETIIYPSTAFMRKKSKKKKKSTVVNNNIIEDLQLEDVNNDDDSSINTKKTKSSTRKTIKNAFYN